MTSSRRSSVISHQRMRAKNTILGKGGVALIFLVIAGACGGDTATEAPDDVPHSAATPSASFELSARILGPVERDDASDILVTLRETGGVDATLHFIRLTCTNGAAQEWGADSFVGEFGSNTIAAWAQSQIQRSYSCSDSARPSLVTAQLTDKNGHEHTVEAVPFHPDWPG
jgi:hypothetical protein